MALTNQQYEFIMKGYEEAQTRSRHLMNARREEVYRRIPEYRELESSSGSISVACGRRMLDGDTLAMQELHASLEELSRRKHKLLVSAGFPENYLEPVYSCPDCCDTGYLKSDESSGGLEKCHCFRQKEISLLYEQSNIQEMLEKENFSTLSLIIMRRRPHQIPGSSTNQSGFCTKLQTRLSKFIFLWYSRYRKELPVRVYRQ